MSLRSARVPTGPTVVVGAGPHALTIAVRMVHTGVTRADELMIIDPAGAWLENWRSAFSALEIEHLRSPVVHHPHPEPDALLEFVRDRRRGDELHGSYLSPGTALFDDFCEAVIDEYGLIDTVTTGRVRSVDPDGTTVWADTDGIERCVGARRVVIASNPVSPVIPVGLTRDVPSELPEPVHAAQVDHREVGAGDHVGILGGGLTAGHLACAAVSRGARVTLVSRRPVVEREFDTDPGWLGPRYMRSYLGTRSPARRARLATEARGGGSMPRWMLKRLETLVRDGQLTMEVRPHDARAGSGSACDTAEHLGRLGVDHLWCATGWALATTSDQVIGPLVRASSCATADEFLLLGQRLELPGTEVPVHVIGRPATLLLGPTAGNLFGGRRAADLIMGQEHDAIAV